MLLLELALVVVALAVVAWLSRDATKQRHKRQQQAQQARWEREQAELRRGLANADGPASAAPVVMESFTLGWFNMLVQSTWAPVLERLVSNIAAERLQLVLNEVLRKVGGNRRPWKYLEHVSVEEVTFGLAPPTFHFAHAKYDPARQHLQLQVNVRFNSSGFQAVLSPRVRAIGLLKAFSLRLEITQLMIAGRLNLGIQLTSEAPGIKAVEYSFQQEPEFDIQVSPLGLSGMAGELPGLISNLRGLLLKAMSKKVVEPNRKVLDVQKIYRNKYVTKAGGPGGMVTVTVIAARNVGPAASEQQQRQGQQGQQGRSPSHSSSGASARSPFEFAGTPSSSGATDEPDVDPFVEMRFGREVFRTPVVHRNGTSPVWNWQLHLRLPAAIPSADGADSEPVLRDDLLRFSVLNAAPIGEPDALCSGQVRMRDLGLAVNGDAVPLLLPLRASNGQPRGVLQAQVRWLRAVSKPKPFAANVVEPQAASQQQQQQQQQRQRDTRSSSEAAAHKPHLPHAHPSTHAQPQQAQHPHHLLKPHVPSVFTHHHPAHGQPQQQQQRPAGSQPGSPRGRPGSPPTVSAELWPLRTPGSVGPEAGGGAGAAPVSASRQSSGKSGGGGIGHGSVRQAYSWAPWATSGRKGSHTTASSGSAAGDSPSAVPLGAGSFSVNSSAHSAASLQQPGSEKAAFVPGPGAGVGATRLEPARSAAAPLPPRAVPYRLRWPLSSLHKRTASEMPATALESPLSPIGSGSRPLPPPRNRAGQGQGKDRGDMGTATPLQGAPRARLFDDVVREGSGALPEAALMLVSPSALAGGGDVMQDGGGEAGVQLRTNSVTSATIDPKQRERALKRASTTSGAGVAAAAEAADAAIAAVLGGAQPADGTNGSISGGGRDASDKTYAGTATHERQHPDQQPELSFEVMGPQGDWQGEQSSWANVHSPMPSARTRTASPRPQPPPAAPNAWRQSPSAVAQAAGDARQPSPLPSVYLLPPVPLSPLPRASEPEASELQLATARLEASAVEAGLVTAAGRTSPGAAGPTSPAGLPRPAPASSSAPVHWSSPLYAQQAGEATALGDSLTAFQTLAQVVTLQSLLDQERAQAAELSQQLQALRRRYKALSKLRQLENRRALMEGATFQAHTSPQPGGRLRLVSVHVCYVEADRVLRFVEETAGPAPGGGITGGGREAASCSVPIASLAKVELGGALFPKGSTGKGWTRLSNLLQATLSRPRGSRATLDTSDLLQPGQSSGGAAAAAAAAGDGPQPESSSSPDSKCLTLVLQEAGGGTVADGNDGKSAGGGSAAPEGKGNKQAGTWLKTAGMIHLQLPDKGNGRSRDEWATGFNDLVQLGMNYS